MKKLTTAVGAAALLCASSLAAVGAEAAGILTNYSWSLGTMTLDGDATYRVPAWVRPDLPRVREGERVTVIYDTVPNGLPEVTDVRPATS